MSTSDAIRFGLSWLGTYGLHSTLLIAVAWAWGRWWPPRALRERERIWRFALLGGLLTASIQTGLGQRPFAWRFEWPTGADRFESAAPSAVLAARPVPEARTESIPAEPRRSTRPTVLAPRHAESIPLATRRTENTATEARPATAATSRAPASIDARALEARPAIEPFAPEPIGIQPPPAAVAASAGEDLGAAGPSFSWPALVASAWAGLAGLGVFGMLLSWIGLRRRMAGRVPISSGPLFERFEALRQRAGVRGRVRLSTSDALCSPFTVGLVRPEVCIPLAVVTDLGTRQQDAILAHELAHVRRRDPTWACLLAWLERVLFFQPLNRLARSELAELAELTCDEQAVAWTGGRLTLAGTLTEVAGWVLDGRPHPARLPGLVGHRSRLARRVARLLEDDGSREVDRRRWWSVPVGALVLTGFAIAAPGVASTTARERPSPTLEEAPSTPVPAAEPAHAELAPAEPAHAEPAAPTPGPGDLLQEEQLRLAEELELLRSGIAALAAELEGTDLGQTFAEPIARLEARLGELDGQHTRIRELLDRLRAAGPARSPIHPTSESEPTIRR